MAAAELAEGPTPGSFVCARGLRYVVPYEHATVHTVKDAHAGKPVVEALAEVFRLQRGEQDLGEAVSFWKEEIESGRVRLRRHKRSRDDQSELAQKFCPVPPSLPVHRMDRVEVRRHVHERAISDDLPRILSKHGPYVAVLKPGGVPCVDGDDGCANVAGVLAKCCGVSAKLRLCHRLDAPVSGLLITAVGGTAARKAMAELAAHRARKVYVARVRGTFPETAASDETVGWDSRAGVAVLGGAGGKPARTYFVRLSTTPARAPGADGVESTVLCLPRSGHRHQIRVHLSGLGHPIANDAAYGGADALKHGAGLRVCEDDEAGTLRKAWAVSRRDWCAKCRRVDEALSGSRPMPMLPPPIWLHAARYDIPGVGVEAVAPRPDWAEVSDDVWGTVVCPPPYKFEDPGAKGAAEEARAPA